MPSRSASAIERNVLDVEPRVASTQDAGAPTSVCTVLASGVASRSEVSGSGCRPVSSAPGALPKLGGAASGSRKIEMFRSSFDFGTKAETLQRLRPSLTKSVIPRSYSFSARDWQNDPEAVCRVVSREFAGGTVIVRSSSQAEDGGLSAHAGAFVSLPDIDADDAKQVSDAIVSVLQSYGKVEGVETIDSDNQVLVQEMIKDVALSGVIFTQDMSTGAPYYVVNYDDESGTTDSITSGQYNNRTLYVLRTAVDELSSPRFRALFEAVQEIERVVSSDCLDIEIALDRDGTVILFQVRQITSHPNWNRGLSLRIDDSLQRSEEFMAARYGYRRGQVGTGTDAVLGNMPDWNPAEIIGTSPRRLALSLYRRLITDRTWRDARKTMGYHTRVGRPLMVTLSGQPFIDVRESFYSYLPADLDPEIGDKLVRAWLERLRRNPHLHDKIEFDVAITCYSFDFDTLVETLIPGVLGEAELAQFRERLHAMTAAHVCGELAGVESQFAAVDGLEARYERLMATPVEASLENLSFLLEDATENGTLPFSVLARHGFIASSLLKSLVRNGALTADDAAAFQRSIPTVASDFLRDASAFGRDELSRQEFMARYGHLRPGTYDILSLRYDQRDLSVSGDAGPAAAGVHDTVFELATDRRRAVQAEIEAHELGVSVDELFRYMRRATQGREYAKFIFSKNLSAAIELIAAWGARYNLTRKDLSHIDIGDILDCMCQPEGRSLESSLRAHRSCGRKAYQVATAVKLPYLISSMSDLRIVPLAVDSPNFVTRKNIEGAVAVVAGSDKEPVDIEGKIVVVESADPGFDWIFSKSIKGLITRFGGANSHMAIRCAEFDLPAAIGCGEQIFSRVSSSHKVELLCGQGRIRFEGEH